MFKLFLYLLFQSKLTDSSNTEIPDGIATELDRMMMSGDAEMLDIVINELWPSADSTDSADPERINKLEQKVKRGCFTLLGRTFSRANYDVLDTLAKLRRHIYISCWTKNGSGEQYMWDEYGTDKKTDNRNSVRIETSEDLIGLSISPVNNIEIELDNVRYIDFGCEATGNDAHSAKPFIHKPSVFDGIEQPFPQEEEFRVVSYYKTFELESQGVEAMSVEVDLSRLITGVTVNPQADSGYLSKVKQSLADAGLSHLKVE